MTQVLHLVHTQKSIQAIHIEASKADHGVLVADISVASEALAQSKVRVSFVRSC